VRPAPGLGAQRPGEERAEIVPHLFQLSHTTRIQLTRGVRSPTTPCPATRDIPAVQTASPAPR
jgi:hypothetical protein